MNYKGSVIMTKTYPVIQTDGMKINAEIDAIKLCPLCDHAIDPQYIFGIEVEYQNDKYCCILIFRCTHCEDIFVGRYDWDSSCLDLKYLYPNNIPNIKFESEILDISPQFVKIYSQSQFAEENNLDELAGVGYRKSLEFLIKDFLICQNPHKKQEIVDSSLSDCINSFVKYDKLKIAASRAAWIGNDFTHYEKIHIEYDIEDLKKFIRNTVFWIISELVNLEAKEIKPVHKSKNN